MAKDRALPDLVTRTRIDNKQLKVGAAQAKSEIKGIEGASTRLGSVAQGSFSKFSSVVTGQFGAAGASAQKALDGIGVKATQSGNLVGTAIAGGALVGGAALAALAVKGVSSFVSMTASVRSLQRVTGATAEDSSKLAGVMRTLGIDSSTAEKAFFILSKTIENTPGKLANVGVEVARNSKNNVDLFATLQNVADAYQKAGKGAEGNAIAAAAFGKSGAALLPLLGKTREELDGIAKTLQSRGLIFDQKALDQGLQFTRSMRQMGESVKGLEIQLGSGLVPVITSFVNALTDVVDGVNHATSAIGGIGGIVGAAARVPFGPLESLSDLVHGKFKKGFTEAVPIVGPFAQHLFHIGEGSRDAAESGEKLAATQQEVASAIEDAGKAAEDEAKALDKLVNAQVSLVDSSLGLLGAEDSLARSKATLIEKQTALTQAIAEHGPKSAEAAAASRDLTEAQHSLEDAANRVAHSIADVAAQTADAAGDSLTAEQKAIAYRDALLDQARQIGGPIGAALAELATKIKDLPENKQISIGVAGVESAKAQVDALLAVLRQLSSVLPGIPTGVAPQPAHRAAGGPVRAGVPYQVDEYGSETYVDSSGRQIFIPRLDGKINPSGPRGWDGGSAAPMAAASAGDMVEVTSNTYLDGALIATKVSRHSRTQKIARS